ncbi:MAG: zinc ribbon domain-containing protein [Methanoregula sp.]|jgi:hypothetical protein
MPESQVFTKKYMTRKCGNCGAPASDTNSRFCDLCGAPLIQEPVTPQGLPVCPTCGAIVSDKKAQFCDVCGGPLAKPVCPVCGNQAPSSRSKFCTRCGATFIPGAQGGKNRATPVVPTTVPESEPVVVRPKKGRAQTSEEPSAEWDPWTDGDPLYDISTPLPQQPQEKPLTDLQRIAEGKARLPRPAPEQVPQISGPQRKYSHLPLVADELKQDAERRSAPDSAESRKPGHKAKQEKKGGMFKFLK